jgi:hypothetical protein
MAESSLKLKGSQPLMNGIIGMWEFSQSGSQATFR